MSRYSAVTQTNKAPEELSKSIQDRLTKLGFRLVDTQQNTWQKGMGIMTGPQYIRYEIRPGELLVEGWIAFALLPGVYVGEMGVDGFFAIIPKRALKARIQEIELLAH